MCVYSSYQWQFLEWFCGSVKESSPWFAYQFAVSRHLGPCCVTHLCIYRYAHCTFDARRCRVVCVCIVNGSCTARSNSTRQEATPVCCRFSWACVKMYIQAAAFPFKQRLDSICSVLQYRLDWTVLGYFRISLLGGWWLEEGASCTVWMWHTDRTSLCKLIAAFQTVQTSFWHESKPELDCEKSLLCPFIGRKCQFLCNSLCWVLDSLRMLKIIAELRNRPRIIY